MSRGHDWHRDIAYMRALANRWFEDCEGGFMPDETGNKIATTRTGVCASNLRELADTLEKIHKLEDDLLRLGNVDMPVTMAAAAATKKGKVGR